MVFTLILQQQTTPTPNWFVRTVGFLQDNALGVFMMLLTAAVVVFLLQWIMWSLGVGRFESGKEGSTRDAGAPATLRFIFTDALVKIIDDFRHLLALVVVGIFALAVGWALVTAGTTEDLSKGLQAVVSTLGGLVGGIIGYYFGESTARASGDAGVGGPSGVPVSEQGADPRTPAGTPEADDDIRRGPPLPAAPSEEDDVDNGGE